MSDYEFDSIETAGTTSVEIGQLRVGGYCVINDRPCKITEFSTAKTGKHGHARGMITGVDIFTGKKSETSAPTSHTIEVPNITRVEYSLIDIIDEDHKSYLTCMDSNCNQIDGLTMPADSTLASAIRNEFNNGSNVNVMVWSAMGESEVKSSRVVKD